MNDAVTVTSAMWDFGQHPGWQEAGWDRLRALGPALWAVVDGVNWPEISRVLGQLRPEHCCLYATLDAESRATAPWLVRVVPGSGFAAALTARAQDSHAYVLLLSDAPMASLRAHLRRFTMLRLPEAEAPVYFRFYDPRVMIDAVEAMPDSFLDSFAPPLAGIVVPLSQQCLLPQTCRLTGPEIDPFDDTADCQGRLLAWFGPPGPAAGGRRGPGPLPQTELDAMAARMQTRSVRKLAMRLHREFGQLTTPARCLKMAQSAPDYAAGFGMSSQAQVSAVAQAQLLFGRDFADRYPAIGHVLNDARLLPWQKADRLGDWIAQMFAAQGHARQGEPA